MDSYKFTTPKSVELSEFNISRWCLQNVGLFDLGAYLVGKETFGESVIIHREPVETTSSPKEEVILD